MFFSMPVISPPRVPCVLLPQFDIRSEGTSFKSQAFQGFAALAEVARSRARDAVVAPVPADTVITFSPEWSFPAPAQS